jgi:hypothetical protein
MNEENTNGKRKHKWGGKTTKEEQQQKRKHVNTSCLFFFTTTTTPLQRTRIFHKPRRSTTSPGMGGSLLFPALVNMEGGGDLAPLRPFFTLSLATSAPKERTEKRRKGEKEKGERRKEKGERRKEKEKRRKEKEQERKNRETKNSRVNNHDQTQTAHDRNVPSRFVPGNCLKQVLVWSSGSWDK